MKNFMDTMIKPDNKFLLFLFFIAVNAITFSSGNHDAPFLSTSLICVMLTYFDRKTQIILLRTFDREKRLINDLEKVQLTLYKLTPHESDKFRKIYKNL